MEEKMENKERYQRRQAAEEMLSKIEVFRSLSLLRTPCLGCESRAWINKFQA